VEGEAMRTIRVAAAGLMLGALVALLAGCQTGAQKEPGQPGGRATLRVSQDLQFADIPVPEDFKYVAGESFSAQAMNFRVGQFVYKGDADAFEIIRFYHTQMPSNGWEETRNLDVGQRAILFFRKKDELCTVVVERGTFKTMVRIWLQ
jgi:hypothetical protein